MVAITVILAAVIGAFVLDIGSTQKPTPQNQLSVSANSNFDQSSGGDPVAFTIAHDGGDEFARDDVRVVVRNANNNNAVASLDADNSFSSSSVSVKLNGNTFASGDTVSVGDSLTIESTGSGLSKTTEYTVQVLHLPSDGAMAEGSVQTPTWS